MNGPGDSGAGSLLAVALVGAIVATAAAALPVYIGISTRHAVDAAADAAALAAADVAAGIFPGVPCEVAEAVASGNHTALASCEQDGLVVTVSASRPFLGLSVMGRATAGPPGSPGN